MIRRKCYRRKDTARTTHGFRRLDQLGLHETMCEQCWEVCLKHKLKAETERILETRLEQMKMELSKGITDEAVQLTIASIGDRLENMVNHRVDILRSEMKGRFKLTESSNEMVNKALKSQISEYIEQRLDPAKSQTSTKINEHLTAHARMLRKMAAGIKELRAEILQRLLAFASALRENKEHSFIHELLTDYMKLQLGLTEHANLSEKDLMERFVNERQKDASPNEKATFRSYIKLLERRLEPSEEVLSMYR